MKACATETKLSTPAEEARVWKVAKATFLSWYHKGIIPAAVATGKVIRFDHEQVRLALAKHAELNREGTTR